MWNRKSIGLSFITSTKVYMTDGLSKYWPGRRKEEKEGEYPKLSGKRQWKLWWEKNLTPEDSLNRNILRKATVTGVNQANYLLYM
jgi:hypothetical protein